VLADEEVMTGSIYYPRGFDLISLQSGSQQVFLNASKVQQFRYFDSTARINRRFVSLAGRRGHEFFEVVEMGKVMVLRKLKRYANTQHPDEVESYHYFTWTNGNLRPLIRFRNQVYPRLVEEHPDEIRQYVRHERLNPSTMRAALLIIHEYNRIQFAAQEIHARN